MTTAPLRASRHRRRARLATATIASIVLVGAAGACNDVVKRVFTPPAVTFRDVRVRGVGLQGGTVDVVLRVANPNPYALSATGATYRLLVGDSVEVGRGTTSQPYEVPAHDSTDVTLPLDVSWRGLQQVGRAALADGGVEYRVVGTIIAGTPVGAHDFPLDARGRFAAPSIGGRGGR